MTDSTGDQAAPAAESQSIADRIADQFLGPEKPQAPAGDPTPDAKDAPAEADQAAADDSPEGATKASSEVDTLAEIEIDGQTYSVPEALKTAFIKSADYTRKTQEVAEQRRLVEFQRQQLSLAESERKFGELVKDQLSHMSQLDSAIKQYDSLDWRTLSTDEMIRYKVEIDQLKDRRASLERDVQGRHANWQQEVQKAHAELLKSGMDAVRKAIPNFNDDTIREIKDYAVSEGYTPEEIGSILDPRQVKTLWEAAQYRKLKAGKTPAAKVVSQAKPIGTPVPTARPMDQAARDRIAYSKAKSAARTSSERAKVIEAYLAKTF